LNILFDAALEFGQYWRRPVIEWVEELLPELDPARQKRVSGYIAQVRGAIEDYAADRYAEAAPEQTSAQTIYAWIGQNYPWMDDDNLRRAYSQAMYYAWHG
jgi:hypothetical protein